MCSHYCFDIVRRRRCSASKLFFLILNICCKWIFVANIYLYKYVLELLLITIILFGILEWLTRQVLKLVTWLLLLNHGIKLTLSLIALVVSYTLLEGYLRKNNTKFTNFRREIREKRIKISSNPNRNIDQFHFLF